MQPFVEEKEYVGFAAVVSLAYHMVKAQLLLILRHHSNVRYSVNFAIDSVRIDNEFGL